MNKTNNQNFVSCADIGGSHITAAVVDLNTRSILEQTRVRLAVNSRGSWAEILGTWAEALRLSTKKAGSDVGKIAIAMPGPFDYQQGISWIKGLDKYEAIYGINVKNYLATELGAEPEHILFRNDAEAFLHGEVSAGAGLGFGKIIGITLGTGLGSARSRNGLTEDVNRGSSLFKATIADDYMTTRWFVNRYREVTGESVLNVKDMIEKGEKTGLNQQLFDEFSENLNVFLQDFINDEDPDLLVIGGNIARAWQLFLPALRLGIKSPNSGFEIRIAELGEDSAIMGAACTFEPILQSGS